MSTRDADTDPETDIVGPGARAVSGAVLVGLLAIGAVVLTVVVRRHGGLPLPMDAAVLGFLVDRRGPTSTAVLTVLTYVGGPVAMTVLGTGATLWLAYRGYRAQAGWVAAVGLGGIVLVRVGKALVDRTRPPIEDHLVFVNNQAFPSGHALGSVTVLGALTAVLVGRLTAPRARAALITVAAVLVAAIAFSRLYLGVHWASDVLGGWLYGGAWLGLCLMVAVRRGVLTRPSGSAPGDLSSKDRP